MGWLISVNNAARLPGQAAFKLRSTPVDGVARWSLGMRGGNPLSIPASATKRVWQEVLSALLDEENQKDKK